MRARTRKRCRVAEKRSFVDVRIRRFFPLGADDTPVSIKSPYRAEKRTAFGKASLGGKAGQTGRPRHGVTPVFESRWFGGGSRLRSAEMQRAFPASAV